MRPRRFRILVVRGYFGSEHHYVEQRRWWWPFWTRVGTPSGTVTWYCGEGGEGRYFAEQTIRECRRYDAHTTTVSIKEV